MGRNSFQLRSCEGVFSPGNIRLMCRKFRGRIDRVVQADSDLLKTLCMQDKQTFKGGRSCTSTHNLNFDKYIFHFPAQILLL